ncbi:MAG: primosomal protein N' [Rhodospirillales bacterium]
MSNSDAARTSEDEGFAGGSRIKVLLPLPVAEAYEYRVPGPLRLNLGAFVDVPLGKRTLSGVVWGQAQGVVPEERLRSVTALHPLAALPKTSIRFVEWVADYTVNPAGAVLKMVMSVPDALRDVGTRNLLQLAEPLPDFEITPTRRRVVEVLGDGRARQAAELAREAAVGSGVIRTLTTLGVLFMQRSQAEAIVIPEWNRPGVALTPDQQQAASALVSEDGAPGFLVRLLDGIPGAGKTEVYFEAIADALRRGRQVLVLLPEIALSAQWLARFEARFGAPPLTWHSEVSGSQRRRIWRAVLAGDGRVVVGARSALFLPFPNLGLIIVDEEHDTSFKQEDGVAYHARDMAVVRARIGDIPIILVSATPSLETLVNVGSGRYSAVRLTGRPSVAPPPGIDLVDLRADPPPRGEFLSPQLREAMAVTAQRGEQTLLFLNRRGFAPLTLCRGCGFRFSCPSCTAWLVEHRALGRLVCHHCGYMQRAPLRCPSCGGETLAPCGPGVERLFQEVKAVAPDLRLLVASSDTLTGPGAAAQLVQRIEAHAVDVIIGTQIVAKGYHFPLLTTVGVVDADLGLMGGDLRASERTWQLLTQVAGRAGRHTQQGQVLVQTTLPSHPVMTALASGDRQRFLAAEEETRRTSGMPPFGRLAALILSDRSEERVEAAAKALALVAPVIDGGRILGPAPAPLALLRGRHRRRFLVRGPRTIRLSAVVRAWISKVTLPKSVRLQVDIDPQSFL